MRTSWENPFEDSLWNATGCEFASGRMTLSPSGLATFLRQYRRARIELTVATHPDVVPARPEFELHLVHPESDTATALIVTETKASVSYREGDRWSLVRENSIDQSLGSADTDTIFRINATGSRFLISCGSRLLLNCPQPPSHDGSFYIRLAARDRETVVRQLRIEGE